MRRRLNIYGSPIIGVFATCTEEYVFLPQDIDDETKEELEEALKVTAIRCSAGGSFILGSLLCGNTHGVVCVDFIHEKEIKVLKKHIKTARLTDRLNAAGNLILANDTAALVHPDLSDKAIRIIEKTLGVEVKRGTIAGLKTVGMAGIATNKGVLLHPKATQYEIEVIEDLFNLPVDIGTVNFGSPLVGSGLLANSKGYVAGEDTTGHEISRIEDALGFL